MLTQPKRKKEMLPYGSLGKVIYLYCIVLSQMSESSNTKYLVSVKQVEKSIKLTDEAKTELQSFGMMDEKGKLKLKGVVQKCSSV